MPFEIVRNDGVITMKVNYGINEEERALNNLKEQYQMMITGKVNNADTKNIVRELLRRQKADGSWSLIDDYRVDSDIRVVYVYLPTYYATAILIKADLMNNFVSEAKEKKALIKGLEFATGRHFMGHGFDATASLLDTMRIYKQAGVYEWINRNEKNAPKFCEVFHGHIRKFKQYVENGNTYSDWNVDFKEEYVQEISDYEANLDSYVWYAAYGSNVNRNRFMEYIERCDNKTNPVEDRPYVIPHDIYFASNSRIWEGKGVAFLDDSKKGIALGRVYKITRKQFDDIQKMEGKNYQKKIKLGDLDNLQVMTFTSSNVRTDLKEASNKYLEVIKTGLKEVYPDKSELVLDTYLYSRGNLQSEDIDVLCFIRNSQHGVNLRTITGIATCMTKLKLSIDKLYYYGFIVQDKRSVRQGVSAMSPEAIVYTNPQKRELCDLLILKSIS